MLTAPELTTEHRVDLNKQIRRATKLAEIYRTINNLVQDAADIYNESDIKFDDKEYFDRLREAFYWEDKALKEKGLRKV